MKKILIILLLVGISLPGCSWISPVKKTRTKASEFVKVAKVIDAQRLKEGGDLLIIPFRAGAGVVANEELDRIALMIVKGISDELKDNRPYFNILTAEEAGQADAVIQGHITQMSRSSAIKKWFTGRQKISLAVKGRMVDERTGETIMIFTDKRESSNKAENYSHLGYLIGQGIGRFIVTENR